MRIGRLVFDVQSLGAVLCLLGFALLWSGELWLGALGLELFALSFWLWARAANHPGEQIARWAWLRRPATALWLAAAVEAAAPHLVPGDVASLRGVAAVLVRLKALGVVWAGLELMAALPLARPFADVPGPLLAMRPWLPAVIPAAGFAVLWRQVDHWLSIPIARESAILLLMLTVWLGVLRAMGRKSWSASLRWLFVADSAMAGIVVALDAVTPLVSLLLWTAACGGRAILLAGEQRGAMLRRGPALSRLWRVTMSVASATLALPALVSLGFAPGGRARIAYLLVLAIPVAMTTALTIRRHVEAPERRLVMRPQMSFSLSHLLALITVLLGPAALVVAWWSGYEVSPVAGMVAVLPPLVGAAIARPGRDLPLRDGARSGARSLFRFVVQRERGLVGAIVRVVQTLTAPLRDLHTGDAQEYVLFVVGVSVFSLILPLLQ